MMTQAPSGDPFCDPRAFEADEESPPFFSLARILRWTLIGAVTLILIPVGSGFIAAKLFGADRETGRILFGLVPALVILALALVGWRRYRQYLATDPVLRHNPRAVDRQLNLAAIWRDAVIAGTLLGMGGMALHGAPQGPARIALLIAMMALTGVAAVRGTLIYMQRVDEQERDANLWGAYCGVTVYVLLFGAQLLAKRFDTPIPHAHELIFGAVLATTPAVTLWKRFR